MSTYLEILQRIHTRGVELDKEDFIMEAFDLLEGSMEKTKRSILE